MLSCALTHEVQSASAPCHLLSIKARRHSAAWRFRASFGMASKLLLFIIWATSTVFAGELPKPYYPMSQVDFLSRFLRENSTDFHLIAVDLFEKEGNYRPYAPSSQLSQLRYVISKAKDKAPAFAAEMKLIKLVKGQARKDAKASPASTKSLAVQTSFRSPGRENFVFHAVTPISFSYELVQASLWIHSRKYPHKLVLIFEDAKGSRVYVSTGPLLWHGWRRVSLDLPVSLAVFPRLRDRRQPKFIGFMIKSPHYWAADRQIALQIDNFLVLGRIRRPSFAGDEVPDNWGRK